MFKYFVIIFFLFISSVCSIAQGFDWQWSARVPIENPRNYYGINANYGLDYSIGAISFKENNVPAPDFIDANGNNLGIGINYTYWEQYNRYAIYGIFRYNNFKLSSYSIDNVPINNDIIAQYKVSLDYNFHLLTLQGGINYRLLESHLLIGAGIEIGAIINNSFSANEEILGPPEVPPFSTNPPSYKREITAGKFKELNNLFLKPQIRVSYDLELGRGSYVEPNVCFSIPLWSMFSGDKVRHYSILFGINYYTSFF